MMFRTIFTRGTTFVADIFFPITCIGCGGNGAFLCESCRATLPRKLEQECFVCRKAITPSGEPCFACRKSTSLDGVFVAAPFSSSTISEAIHVLKYEYVESLAPPLATFLASALSQSDIPLPDSIVPIPLHPLRQRFRGFNQSTLLAHGLAHRILPGTALPVSEDTLIRARFTLPQVKTMNRDERRANLAQAFSLHRDTKTENITNRTFWLVDDVMTTGSTLEACATILKQSGARAVYGIVLAR